MGGWEGDGQREPGEAGAGADVGHPLRGGNVMQVEGAQAVGDVHAGRLGGPHHRRGRVGLVRQRLQKPRQAVDLVLREVGADTSQRPRFP